jgi:hypothetical protein
MMRHVMEVGFQAFSLDIFAVSRKVANRAKNLWLRGVGPLSISGFIGPGSHR